MKPTLPSPSDPLLRLLDEWQPAPEASADFDLQLRRRIAAAAAGGGLNDASAPPPAASPWWTRPSWLALPNRVPALGSLALLILVGIFFFLRTANPASHPLPAAAPGVQSGIQMARSDPMVRDLQTLDTDRDLLENLDFLSASHETLAPAKPRLQDRD